MGAQGSLLRDLTSDILDTVDRLGGQMVWRGTLIHLVKSAKSVSEAQKLLARISDPKAVIETFWSGLVQGSGYSPELLRAVTDVLVSTHGPLTLLQIYDTISASHPHTLDGVNVSALGALMKDKFSACTSVGYGFFDMDSLMRRTLKEHLASLEPLPEHEGREIPRENKFQLEAPPASFPASRSHTVSGKMPRGTGVGYHQVLTHILVGILW
jgi:hypothetical protein